MSERPQAAREEEQEDLLERIITQGLDQMNAPGPAEAAAEVPGPDTPPAPKQEEAGKAASSANRRNRRTAVYLYLLILFGAAFLMLLLAYFVQQRSNESTISDLKDSMNLSREELLNEIRDLETENEALNEEIDHLNEDLTQWQERYEEKDGELTDLENLLYDTQEKVYSWESFWALERYYQAEDYESCAALLILLPQGQFSFRVPDAAQERYEEIVQAVIDAGILDEDYDRHPDRYNELLNDYLVEHPVLVWE